MSRAGWWPRRALAPVSALVIVLGVSGCSSLQGIGKAPGTGEPAAAARGAASGAAAGAAAAQPVRAGIRVEIDARADLKALLERHLDIVRLGRIARGDVAESEWARLIDATPMQARALLETEGYFRARVQLARINAAGPGEPELVTLTVEPGERARISRVTLEFEGEAGAGDARGEAHARETLAELRRRFALAPGAEFRNAAWSEAKTATLGRLRAAGYANAGWSGTAADVDTEKNEVRLFLVADSGPLFRYGSLLIEGLVRHERETVLNLADTARGAPVSEPLLLDFQERLQKSGLFESSTVTLDNDPARAEAAQIVVRVREAPLQVWTFGLGVSANTGPRATVEHLYRRVFDYPATSRNKVEWGQKRQFWEGEISTHPGEGLYRNLVGGAVENLVSDSDEVLSQRLRVGRTQDTQRIERLYFVEAERSRRETNAGVRSNTIAYSVNYHGVWRDLDSVILPTQGLSFAGQVGLGQSRGTDAPRGNFQRAYGRLTAYLPFGRAWYGQARVELGRVFLPSGVAVPDSQKWRAGGDDSVRGYAYRSLGPVSNGAVGSGLALMTASVELARPLSERMPSLWGAVFVDAGNAADSFSTLDLALGVGIGVRWRSPVGPLRVDWAYGRETRQPRLHFSIGIAF